MMCCKLKFLFFENVVGTWAADFFYCTSRRMTHLICQSSPGSWDHFFIKLIKFNIEIYLIYNAAH